MDAIKACHLCGPNSVCSVDDDESQVFCKCAPNAEGVPPNCTLLSRPPTTTTTTPTPLVFQCRDNFDCSSDKICDRDRCRDPCSWVCSREALCHVDKHEVTCRCPPGHGGDPRFECSPIRTTTSTTARPSTTPGIHPCQINCGKNTVCRAVGYKELESYRNKLRDGREEHRFHDMIKANEYSAKGLYSECLCRRGFEGNPYSITGCERGPTRGTVGSTGPPSSVALVSQGETVVLDLEMDPCKQASPCGPNSFCRSFKGKAFCSCDMNASGHPPNCRRQCTRDSHCLFHEICVNGACIKTNNNV